MPQDLFDALCANNGEAIRLLLPAVVSDVIISFSFAERAERKRAQLDGHTYDGFGCLVVRARFDIETISKAHYDGLRMLARPAQLTMGAT